MRFTDADGSAHEKSNLSNSARHRKPIAAMAGREPSGLLVLYFQTHWGLLHSERDISTNFPIDILVNNDPDMETWGTDVLQGLIEMKSIYFVSSSNARELIQSAIADRVGKDEGGPTWTTAADVEAATGAYREDQKAKPLPRFNRPWGVDPPLEVISEDLRPAEVPLTWP